MQPFQRPALINCKASTIRENLKYGNENASDEELLHAIRLCQAEYLLAREGGLDAKVALFGKNFSLGERQLLAFARVLVANPQILVLDEATASIDTYTERKLQNATKKLLKDRTSIVVAHRLSTIEDCDKILVFHKGEIEEQGTHESLIKEDGIYAKFIALQKEQEIHSRPI